MEITSLPLEDFSQFFPSTPYSELQPLDSPLFKKLRLDSGGVDHINESVDLFLKKTDTDTDTSAIKDILASAFMFGDEGESQDQPHSWPVPYDDITNNSNNNEDDDNNNMNNDSSQVQVVATGGRQTRKQQRNKRSRDAAAAMEAVVGESSAAPPPAPHHRRLWVKDRSNDWWVRCSQPDYPEEEFRKAFRMSKATFDMICEDLEPVINKKDTMLRAAIPVNQRVAVCLWRLATGEPLRLVSKRFGLGISTCHKLVLEVCSAIKTTLMGRFLQWPNDARMAAIKQEFEAISGIPNVGGAIYTTHIPIIAPKENVTAYFNRRHTERNQKTSYTVTVQGVVDPNGYFTDVCIGWPGSLTDENILEKSALYERANLGLFNNVQMVGNSHFPLMDWVLVPYTHQNLTWTQHNFNEKLEDIQKVARDSFARLKKRWGCLQKRTEVKLQELPVVLGACCVLHNICEIRKEEIPEAENAFELFDDDFLPENVVRSGPAVQARDYLAHNLLHHGGGTTSF